jgi:peptide chain release factor 1
MPELIFQATKKDFEVEYFRGSGPGGQHRNKRDTACRIRHKPTGLFSESQRHKSRERNKREAFRKLAQKLIDQVEEEHKVERDKPTEVIRTYHFPRSTVKDHRSGVTLRLKDVLDGGIQPFIDAVLLD